MACRKLRSTREHDQVKNVQGRSKGITKKPKQTTGRKSLTKIKDLPSNELKKTRHSARFTPMETYDFIGDSPVTAGNNKANNKKKQSAKQTKPVAKKNTAPKTNSRPNNVAAKAQTKPHRNVETAKSRPAMITPKTRVRKVSHLKEDAEREKKRKKRPYSPLPPPNLDDLSPIGHDTTADSSDGKNQKRKLRSSIGKPITETPSVSFIVSRSKLEDSNDSAIFVSPRKTMPNFGTEKTSTPAGVSKKNSKKQFERVLQGKNTSTPNEIRPLKQYTVIKTSKAKPSPVPRTETPTSDYGSMEMFESPEVQTTDLPNHRKRAHSPDPVLHTDDHGDEDSMALNKSLNKSYKQRTKRKYESSKKTESRMEEWIEKVNSELEDVENFELSVEG